MTSLTKLRFTRKPVTLILTLILLSTAIAALRASTVSGKSESPGLAQATAGQRSVATQPLASRQEVATLAPLAPGAVPQPPIAVDDLYATPRDTPLYVPAWEGVLANDLVPSGGTLTATLEAPPASGTLTLTLDGGFVYQPPPGYNGLITFTYNAHTSAIVGSGIFSGSGQIFGDDESTGNAVALGDLDGDGDADAVVGIPMEHEYPGLWLNAGDGSFIGSADPGWTWGAQGVALGDLDGDTDLDFATAGDQWTWANVFFNQGGAQGGTPGTFSSSDQNLNNVGLGVALGDLDGDGDLDLVYANNGPNTVYTNTHQSGIFSDTGRRYGNAWSLDVALGDVDGDEDLDAVFANVGPYNKIYINEGGDQGGTPGIFSDSGTVIYHDVEGTDGVALGDLDGDGDLDAVFAVSWGSTVWLNDGFGVYTRTAQTLASGADVALGDVNDDGHLDIFIADYGYNTVWLNNGQGDGIFTDSGQRLSELWSKEVALADLDGDADLDAFVADEPYLAAVWLNQSTTRVLSDTATVRLLVGDVPGPADVLLDQNTVAENQPTGTLVGVFDTIDPSSDAHTYTLVPGPGSEHNDAFTIVGDQLQTATVFDYEGELSPIRSIRVRADNGELAFEKALLVHITDVEPEPDGPPTHCQGDDITLFDTQDAGAALTALSVSNYDPSTGCDLDGMLSVRLPGNNLTGIPFHGHVDRWNKLYSDDIAPLDLQISGLPLHADQVRLASYAGKMSVRLGTAEVCAPADWGGQCVSATHANLRVDGSGLFIGSGGELPIPEMSIHQTAPQVQAVTGPAAPNNVYTLLDLDFFQAELTPVHQDPLDEYSPILGYEIKASAELGLPKISGKKGSDGKECSLSVYVILYQSVSGVLNMTIETAPPEVGAPSGLEFREGHLGLSCSTGIPIDATGLQVSGVYGTISLRPDAQWVEIGLEITNSDSSLNPSDLQLLKIEAIVKILWQPEWGIDLTGRLTLLEYFEVAEATTKIRSDSFSFTLNIQTWFVRGRFAVYAWWPDGSFHFSGSGRVTVGLWKGFIWSWCAPWPFDWLCIIIPPFDITLPPVGADFGEFTNGRYGLKGYIEVFGKQYGFYVDEGGDFDIGGVSEYTIVTPEQFARALQRWRAAQAQAERDGLWLDPQGWDDTFSFPAENTAAIKVHVSPSDVITRMQVITPTDVSFLVGAQAPVTVALRTPGGLTITPDNYNVPPISPTHNVFYTVTQQITYTQYWYDVRPAEIGEWQVIVEGDLDAAQPLVGVVGFANLPTLGAVTVADASDPSQVPVDWSLTSDVPATITVYANRGAITSTVTVTDTGGVTQTQVISNFHGIPVGEFPVTGLAQLQGATGSGIVDLTALESDDYALWTALEDGIQPAINTYARIAGTGDVAVVTVDNSATFPTTWSPVITPTILTATRQLLVECAALPHPDVDDYTIYVGLAPDTPDIAITGLSATVQRDALGRPLGAATVWHNIADVGPGQTYYFSFQANDAESAQSVRTAEISIAIPSGDFQLTTPRDRYLIPQGGQVVIPLALDVSAPLFYPQVYVEIDDAGLARGISALFQGDTVGETTLSAANDTVNAVVTVDAFVPSGIYTLAFVGYSGELEKRIQVNILVPQIYLPLILKEHE